MCDIFVSTSATGNINLNVPHAINDNLKVYLRGVTETCSETAVKIEIFQHRTSLDLVGEVWLILEGSHWETHSYVQTSFRSRGVGAFLYSLAFELGKSHNLSIRSTKRPTKEARRVWESKTLRNRYFIVSKDGVYHLQVPENTYVLENT